jgi:hypothetical protein
MAWEFAQSPLSHANARCKAHNGANRYGLRVPNQRGVGAEERSGFATSTGIPWWGAVLIALTATLLGIAIEAGSGHQELGGIFAALYALGCVAAVLTVRQSGLFTAVIQPPLLLFVGVPLAYYLLHESEFSGLKDVLITCGYPLIERFPLMLFTSSAVLVIGLVRWYLVMSSPRRPQPAPAERPGVLAALSTKLASAFAGNGSVDEEPGDRPARPRHVVDRAGTKRPPRTQTRRSRGARPPVEEFAEFGDTPPRRRQNARRPAREEQWAPASRRTSREPRDPRRTPPPPRRERPDYRDNGPARPTRGSRFEPYDAGRGYPSYPQGGPRTTRNPYEPPYGPPHAPEPRRRPTPTGGAGSHHPISRVRYRDVGPVDAPYDADRDRPPRR